MPNRYAFNARMAVLRLPVVALSLCPAAAVAAETYSLVQARGNTEHVSAKGLTKPECEARKKELKAVSEALGTYNEKSGSGSITCLPDSLYAK